MPQSVVLSPKAKAATDVDIVSGDAWNYEPKSESATRRDGHRFHEVERVPLREKSID